MAKRIFALHGFLGCPHDFKPLGLEGLLAPRIFLMPLYHQDMWAFRFNRSLPLESVVMGYSMGGRLALSCLINNPSKFTAAIIIAAHPGIKDLKERQARINRDYWWAHKFLSEPWSQLMEAWNAQALLKSSGALVRNEQDFHRLTLASWLRHFSLGKQEYLVGPINELKVPILWLYAEEEHDRSQALVLKHPRSQKIGIQGGHRFMFKFPELVRKKIINFLGRLDESGNI